MTTTDTTQAASQLAHLIDANPNDPQVLRAVEGLLHTTDSSPTAASLVFKLYLHPRLTDAARGIVTALVLKAVRKNAGLFHPATMGLDTDARAFKMLYRGLAHHLDAAVDELALIARFQNKKFDEASAPKFIVAIPKSGSSLLGMCLGGMIALSRGASIDDNPFAFRGYPAWWKVGGTHDWDLRPEIGADPLFKRFPGGVYKGHITPTDKNFAVLGLYGKSRYLVCVRDPRDQIVAAYCDTRRAQLRAGQSPHGARTEADVHEDVLAFLRSGLLLENLTFVGKWLARRHSERSLVVTYEDLLTDPLPLLRRVADHFDLPTTDAQIEQLHARAAGVTSRVGAQDKSGHDPAIYPLGWTGRLGISRTYLSDEAAEAFEDAFRGFAAASPWGEPIAALYPDLASALPEPDRTALAAAD